MLRDENMRVSIAEEMRDSRLFWRLRIPTPDIVFSRSFVADEFRP
jgi:hypothetical protein